MFDQDADEALESAQNGAVEHHRAVLLSVLPDVGGVEPFRQDIVELDRSALPRPADCVSQMELKLGRIERTFAGEFFPLIFRTRTPREPHGFAQVVLRTIPHFVGPKAFLGPQGKLDRIAFKAQVLVDLVEQITECPDLIDDLILTAEDVAIVLRHLPDPHQAMQRAVEFIAMATAHFRHAQREIAVAFDALPEDQHVGWAVHRLQRHQVAFAAQDLVVVIGVGNLVGNDEHILAIFAPVPGGFPLLGVHQLRRLDFVIPAAINRAAHISLQLAPDEVTLGVPEDRAVGLALQMEQVHLGAELAVVALGGLFEPDQMLVQLLLVEPAGAVNAAEHRFGLIAAPIGTRNPCQFEGVRVELAGAGQMRPAAHIKPVITRPINRQRFVTRQLSGPFGLETFALLLPAADQLFAAPHFAAQRLVGGDDLAHLRFDRGQVLVGERAVLWREVIVEPVVGARPESDLRARKQRLHRFGQNVGEIVPGEVKRIGLIPGGHQRQAGIAGERQGQIDQLAINARGQCRFGEARTNCRSNIGRGRTGRHFAHRTIGKADCVLV